MGFFDWVKSTASKVYGAVSNVARKFGEVSSPILKKFADLSTPIGNAIGFDLHTASAVSGRPEFKTIADGVRQGAGMVGDVANKAYEFTSNLMGNSRSRPEIVDFTIK